MGPNYLDDNMLASISGPKLSSAPKQSPRVPFKEPLNPGGNLQHHAVQA